MFPCNTVKFLRDPTAWIKETDHVLIVEEINKKKKKTRSLVINKKKKQNFKKIFFKT